MPNKQNAWQLHKGTQSHEVIFWPDSEKLQDFVSFKNWEPLLIRKDTSNYGSLPDYETPNTNCKFWTTSKMNPKQLLMTSYWLSNNANQLFNSSPNKLNPPKVFFFRNSNRQKKMTGLVKIHIIPKFLQKFVRSLVQNMNRGPIRRLLKGITAATAQKFWKNCRTEKQSTNFLEIGSKTDEIEESASVYSFFIGYSNYIKNGTVEKFSKCGWEVPMMRDTGASLTLICMKNWQHFGEPNVEKMASGIEIFDQHKMQYNAAFFSKVLYEKNWSVIN